LIFHPDKCYPSGAPWLLLKNIFSTFEPLQSLVK
jgi:hypothetical protein